MRLGGWGRYPRIETRLTEPHSIQATRELLDEPGLLIGRGMGRSYGDSAVAPGRTVGLTGLGAVEAFDQATGLITVQAGAVLRQVLPRLVAAGWFPPVTPGTQDVTFGGMVASDVHGKNHHHDGSFCRHVQRLEMLLGDGTCVECSPRHNPDLFRATCGGMGLTGLILRVTLQLRRIDSTRIRRRVLVADDLDQALALLAEHGSARYAVAWIDALAKGRRRGRGLVMLGEHARGADLPPRHRGLVWPDRDRRLRIPAPAPGWLLSAPAMRAFNRRHYRRQRQRAGESLVSMPEFFYPLDRIERWNLLYGRRGFVQLQCALPERAAAPTIEAILQELDEGGARPLLAVLKPMGPQGRGLLSFPMPGITLAVDLPLRADTPTRYRHLESRINAAGGRLYLSKDALMAPESLEAGYGERLTAFRAIRATIPGSGRWASAQSHRLGITDAAG